MYLFLLFCLLYVCSGSVTVQAKQTTFNILPSKNVSNAESVLYARSLFDCGSGCSSVINCSTATYNPTEGLCYVCTTDPIIVDAEASGVTTISINRVLASHYGTNFVTGFMNNGIYNEGTPYLMLVSSVPTPTNVWVTIPYLGIYQEHHLLNGHLYLQYSNTLMPPLSTTITGNGVEVTTDQPIVLFSINQMAGSTDGTLVFPTNLLGKEYIIDTHNSTMWGTGQIVVMAVSNATEVTLVLPNGSAEIIVLNQFETYQLQATASEPLAGTMISADENVAVHAGHMCANVPDHSVLYCDILVTAIPPMDNLGQVFIVPYQRPRTNHSIGIVAPYNGTEVSIYRSNGSLLETVQLNARGSIFRSFFSSEILSVLSTGKIMVTQYGHGSEGVYGDPSLTVIPTCSQYGNRYTFAIPTNFDDPSVVSIVTKTKNSQSGFMLNGFPINITESATVTVPGEGDFNVWYVNVNNNATYSLYHEDPNVRFGSWLYARNVFEEYTTALGFDLLQKV